MIACHSNFTTHVFYHFSATSGGFKGQKVMLVSSGANKVTNTNTSASSPIASASNQTIKIVQVGNQPRKAIAIMPNTTSKIQTSALTTTTTSNVSKISSTISSSGHSASVISGSSLIPTVASNSTLNTKDNLKRKLEEMEVELEKDRLAMEEKMAKIRKMKAELYETTPESDFNLETDDTDTNNTAM